MILRILIGLLIAAAGFGIVWKTRILIDFLGTNDWADRKFGGGGTNLLYKLIGIAIIFIGFMWATNLWNEFLAGTIGWLFPVRSI